MGDGWQPGKGRPPGEECLPDKGSRSPGGASLERLGDLGPLEVFGDLVVGYDEEYELALLGEADSPLLATL